MPSYGLIDDSECVGEETRRESTINRSGGTYRIPWCLTVAHEPFHISSSGDPTWNLKAYDKDHDWSYDDRTLLRSVYALSVFERSPSKCWHPQPAGHCVEWTRVLAYGERHFRRNRSVLVEKLTGWSVARARLREEEQQQLVPEKGQVLATADLYRLKQFIDSARITRKIMSSRVDTPKHNDQVSPLKQTPSLPITPIPDPITDSKTERKTSVALRHFEDLCSLMQPIMDSVHLIETRTDKAIQDACLKIRMSINKKVVQIANSRQQVSNVVSELLILLAGGRERFNPDLVNYAMYILCKKLIEQAETQVSLHSPSAFPIAQVIVDLSVLQPKLLQMLLYMIMMRCPYAVPRYIERIPGQSEQEYKAAQGYIIDGSSIENEASYTERMAGILSLLGAIMQTKPTLQMPTPYGIEFAWIWIASVLNIKPQSITPYLICAFLESAGHALLARYGNLFLKVLRFIQKGYLGMIPAGSIAAKTRLDIFVNDALSGSPPSLPPPEGSNLLP